MLTTKGPKTGWQKVYAGSMEIGGFGETTRDTPSLRWYWTGQGRYGHCATRDEAIAELAKLVPEAEKSRDADRAARAAFDALPADLQELKAAMDAAEFERQRVWGRQPFNSADYAAAADAYDRAYRAFHVAHDRWMAQREAA